MDTINFIFYRDTQTASKVTTLITDFCELIFVSYMTSTWLKYILWTFQTNKLREEETGRDKKINKTLMISFAFVYCMNESSVKLIAWVTK